MGEETLPVASFVLAIASSLYIKGQKEGDKYYIYLVQRGTTNPPAQKHARQPFPTPYSLLPTSLAETDGLFLPT